MSIAWNEEAAETLEFSSDLTVNNKIKLAVSGLQKSIQRLFLELPTDHDKELVADFIIVCTKQENISLATRHGCMSQL